MRRLSLFAILVASFVSSANLASAQIPGQDIPITVIEATVDRILRDTIPARVTGRETCSSPCPNANWRVDLRPRFRFLSTNAPTVTPRGPSGFLDGADLEFDAQAEVVVDADPYIQVGEGAWDYLYSDIDPPVWHITKIVGIHVTLSFFTVPGTEKDPISVNVSLTDDGGNVNVDGLNHDFVVLGAETGALIGLAVFGSPWVTGIFGALVGDRAAEAAEERIKQTINREASRALAKASNELNTRVQAAVVPQANRLYDALAVLISMLD